jgi:hypothetical protein
MVLSPLPGRLSREIRIDQPNQSASAYAKKIFQTVPLPDSNLAFLPLTVLFRYCADEATLQVITFTRY